MTTSIIRKKLHQYIDTMEDKKAAAFYALLADEMDMAEQRKKLILAEREKYLNGEGKSYTWNEVKEMAMNKTKRRVV